MTIWWVRGGKILKRNGRGAADEHGWARIVGVLANAEEVTGWSILCDLCSREEAVGKTNPLEGGGEVRRRESIVVAGMKCR
jgi:hypothetical protein